MIEPISNIAPLREDLAKLVPDRFLVTTAFKRWTVEIGLNNVWKKHLDYVQSLLADDHSNDAGEALTLLLNNYYNSDKEELGSFIFQLLELYSKENDGDFDVDDICKDLEIINVSKDTIDKIKTLNRKSEKTENASKQIIGENENKKKTPMVFISHSSKDHKFVEALVEMLEGIGLNRSTLFCSSVDGYKIPLGQNIFDYLYALFQEHELFVIFVHTPNYYNNPACLNEMGAAWVLKTDYCSILSKDMSFDDMKGVVKPDTISIKVDDANDASGRLTELKDKLITTLGLGPIDEILWERKRNNFLTLVNSL